MMLGYGLFLASLPNNFRFALAGAEFEQLPDGFGGEKAICRFAEGLFAGRSVNRHLPKELLEMIARERLDGEKVRFSRIELGFDPGFGKNDAAFTTGPEHDPLRTLAIFVQQGNKFIGADRGVKLELFFDFFEFLVEDGELVMKGKALFYQSGDRACMSGGFGFHGPSPPRVLFLEVARADGRRQAPTCADIRRRAPSELF
jgi:hypothetical protein